MKKALLSFLMCLFEIFLKIILWKKIIFGLKMKNYLR